MDTNRRRQRELELRELEEVEDEGLAERVAGDCFDFLRPLMKELDEKLDVRLVRTLANAVLAIVRHRNRALALLLSDVGAVLAGPKRAPPGPRRPARLDTRQGGQAGVEGTWTDPVWYGEAMSWKNNAADGASKGRYATSSIRMTRYRLSRRSSSGRRPWACASARRVIHPVAESNMTG